VIRKRKGTREEQREANGEAERRRIKIERETQRL
jgi:hypothetical protein